ncbi:Ferric reduction oxidase 7, partial [Globisporangium splendens]
MDRARTADAATTLEMDAMQRKRVTTATTASTTGTPVSADDSSMRTTDAMFSDDDDLDALLTDDDLLAADAENEKYAELRKKQKRRLANGSLASSSSWCRSALNCVLSLRQSYPNVLVAGTFCWMLATLFWIRSPLYLQWIAEPMEKTLGGKRKAEIEPRVVATALVVPFIMSGALFYWFELAADATRVTEWKKSAWMLWLRRQRRALVPSGFDSVDVLAIGGFAVVQLNCFVGKILIDDYTGKLAKAGLLARSARTFGMNGLYAVVRFDMLHQPPCILSILLVSRQSFFHKYFHLSSERAAVYHVWTGNFGVINLLLHGILYGVVWVRDGKLQAMLIPCSGAECTPKLAYQSVRNFSGLLALIFLLVVALGSMEWMRRRHFRKFSIVHCLNVLFVVFTCIHYYPAVFWLVPCILVYVVYRVISLFGQQKATVVSVASLSDKIVQLEIRRDASGAVGLGDFHAGQYVYIKVDEIGRNEWHPFSISSSPLKNRHSFHLDAKVQGPFTRQLLEMIKAHRLNTVKVDGYYGTTVETCAHMVFVAGGSGMTPFLSVLEQLQLLSEKERAGEVDGDAEFPKTLWVIWTGRDIELFEAYAELLLSIKKSTRWKSNISLHLTASLYDDEEEERLDGDSSRVEKFYPSSMHRHAYAHDSHLRPLATFLGVSVGSALLMYLAYIDEALGQVWWLKRLALFFACALGAGLGGSLVLVARRMLAKRANDGVGSAMTELEFAGDLDMSSPVAPSTPRKFPLASASILSKHFPLDTTRPDLHHRLRSIHSEIQENYGMVADVGVFVSGPSSLQADVLRHTRSLHSPFVAVHQKSFTV